MVEHGPVVGPHSQSLRNGLDDPGRRGGRLYHMPPLFGIVNMPKVKSCHGLDKSWYGVKRQGRPELFRDQSMQLVSVSYQPKTNQAHKVPSHHVLGLTTQRLLWRGGRLS